MCCNIAMMNYNDLSIWCYTMLYMSFKYKFILQAIHNRLPCGAIFDFMDYIQPDANNWRRSSEINTGLALQLAIITSWFNFFAWCSACSINFIMARRRLQSLGEKFCCCCWSWVRRSRSSLATLVRHAWRTTCTCASRGISLDTKCRTTLIDMLMVYIYIFFFFIYAFYTQR